MIKIHNLRLGHATNSSSSHSIVIAPRDYGHLPSTEDEGHWGEYNYGWEHFVLADPESKTKYFAVQLFDSLTENGISADIAKATIRDWIDFDIVSNERDYVGVDHQSQLSFPIDQLNKEFDNGSQVKYKYLCK